MLFPREQRDVVRVALRGWLHVEIYFLNQGERVLHRLNRNGGECSAIGQRHLKPRVAQQFDLAELTSSEERNGEHLSVLTVIDAANLVAVFATDGDDR